MKLLQYDKFMDAFIKLPRNIQKKVIDFQRKFRQDSKSSGIHLEPISTFKDPQLRTGRIDRDYRVIIRAPESGDVYYLLWVDNHDKAYRWAENKIFQWNDLVHSIQVITIPEGEVASEVQEPDQPSTFMAAIGKEKLMKLGVPEILMPTVIAITDMNDLEKAQAFLPDEVFENLFYLLDGASIDALITEVEAGKSSALSIDEQAQSFNNQRHFIEFTDDEMFNEALQDDLRAWKFYLHPSQRRLVEGDNKGPVKVTGGAGTGKTVAALHRLKHLVALKPAKPVLFVTFTKALTKNLVGQTRDLEIDPVRFELSNIDSLAFDLARKEGVLSDEKNVIGYSKVKSSDALWDEVMESVLTDRDKSFLMTEYRDIILYHNIKDKQAYFSILRTGRGEALSRRKRNELWKIFEVYNEVKDKYNLVDRDELFNLLSDHFQEKGSKPFSHVIADELQDLSNVELRFLRSIVSEGPNDLFLVGDPFQKIYDRVLNFSKAGIHIRGKRSIRLRINYRTSEEIRRKAISIIDQEYFDDFNGEEEQRKGYLSLFHGNEPTYQLFHKKQQELDYLFDMVKNIVESQHKFSDIVVSTREKANLKEYRSLFHQREIPSFDINSSTGDKNGVHFCTLHSLKGLEFKHVFLVDINDRSFPYKPYDFSSWRIEDQEDHIKREKSLFYVAMTRAVQSVSISGVGDRSEILDF